MSGARPRFDAVLRRLAASFGVEQPAQPLRWLLRIFVLPPTQARPWPALLARAGRWLQRLLSNELQVGAPAGFREWTTALLLLPPARARPWPRALVWLGLRVARIAGVALAPLRRYSLVARQHIERFDPVALTAHVEARMPALTEGRAAWRYLLVVVAALLLLVTSSTPLDYGQQILVSVLIWSVSLGIRRLPGAAPTLLLVAFSLFASSRYIWWRITQTLELKDGLEYALGVGLVAAEAYAWLILLLGYLQSAWALRRSPLPLPADESLWPSVDIFIPTYDELLPVVKPAVFAALSLDWPRDRLRIYLLDDGHRQEFRDFARDCGVDYIARERNINAKAGNLNHALGMTSGEFVAIFDCDHVPVRSFLQMTMGSFLRDPKCAMVQTPHHFFSPDPLEQNLGTFRLVPSENTLFYGLVQDGNDLWNATFFCGSCGVFRRRPLEEVGGIVPDTVTEDVHTALEIHRRGYNSAYINVRQAAGLATETISGHIGQRIRWARGMAQVFRIDNPLFGRGLNLFQRLCYSNAMLHFFNGLPRLVFLTAPLAYLFGELHIIHAPAVMILAYALPHLVQSNLANSRTQGPYRHSFWAEAYETIVACYTAVPTTVALINPNLGSFNVTSKGGLVQRSIFDWRMSGPYLVLVVANLAGALLAIPRLLFWNSFESATVLLNLAWVLFNLVMLGMAMDMAEEPRQVRQAHRVPLPLRTSLYLPDGRVIACRAEEFSVGGLGVALPAAAGLPIGSLAHVSIYRGDREFVFPCRIASMHATGVGLQFEALSAEQERQLIQCTFGRADIWLDWNADTPLDHPLASMRGVLRFGIRGYGRLFHFLREVIRSRRAAALARSERVTV